MRTTIYSKSLLILGVCLLLIIIGNSRIAIIIISIPVSANLCVYIAVYIYWNSDTHELATYVAIL